MNSEDETIIRKPPPLPGAGPEHDGLASASLLCSCGTWYCSSRGIQKFQNFVEKFYWTSPLPAQSNAEENWILETEAVERMISEESAVVEVSGTDEVSAHHSVTTDENQRDSLIGVIRGEACADTHDDDHTVKESHIQNLQVELDYSEPPPPALENMTEFNQESSEDSSAIPILDSSYPEIDHQMDFLSTEPQDVLGIGEISSRPPSPIFEGATTSPLMPVQAVSPLPPLLAETSDTNDSIITGNVDGKPSAEDKQSLALRRNSRSCSNSVFHCSIASCRKKFYRTDALITHEKEHKLGDTRPFFCKVCKRSYINQTSYDLHMTRHRNCKGCGVQLVNASMSKLERSSNPLADYCDNCAEKIRNKFSSSPAEKSDLVKLIRDQQECITTGVKVEKVEIADMKEGQGNVTGEEDAGDLEDQRYTFKANCDSCGKKFKYMKWYELHMLQHSTEKMKLWTCKYCGNVYPSRYTLIGHVKTHPEAKNFQCHKCSEWFMKEHHLKNHMTVHNRSTEFTCAVCKKQFGSNCSLKTHQIKSTACQLKLSRKLGRKKK